MAEPAVERLLWATYDCLPGAFLGQHVQEQTACLLDYRRVRLHLHAIVHWCGARRHRMINAPDLHQAKPAHAGGPEAIVVAKRRYFDSDQPGCLQHGGILWSLDRAGIDGDARHDTTFTWV